MKVRAWVVQRQGGDFEEQELDLDGPRPDEVLVRMVATGLCHTDLTLRSFLPEEMFPRVLGHEGAGVVEQVGSEVSGVAVGDHVVMSFRSCRACARCRAGEVAYCVEHFTLNYLGYRADGSTVYTRDGVAVAGSFFGQSSLASHVIVSADNCVVVDASADLSLLAPFGCGFQTGAGAVLNVLRLGEGDTLAVFGAGAVGLAAIAAACAVPAARVVAVDLNPKRLELAAALGAETVHAGQDGIDVVESVRGLTDGGATAAIDTTALAAVVRQAQLALAPRGTLVALGLGGEDYALDATDLLANGKKVLGSIEGDADPLTFIPTLLEARSRGEFQLDHVVSTYAVEDIARAVSDVESGAVVKPVLVW